MDVIRYPGSVALFDEMLQMARALEMQDVLVLDIPPALRAKYGAPVSGKADLRAALRVHPAMFVAASGLSKISGQAVVIATAEKACFEHPRVAGIMGAEGIERKDRLHQRDSGMNMTLAPIAGRGKKVLLFDLALLATSRKQQVLGRFFQNARLAAKARLPSLVVSGASNPYQMRSPQELEVLGRWLGIKIALLREGESILRARARGSRSSSAKDNKVYK